MLALERLACDSFVTPDARRGAANSRVHLEPMQNSTEVCRAPDRREYKQQAQAFPNTEGESAYLSPASDMLATDQGVHSHAERNFWGSM